MTIHQPLVSVVMPCYNGEAYITEAIDSVLNQTRKEFELIVVNDGSTDRSAEILDSYSDRLVVITQENRGLPAARNAGIRRATGVYVAFLDCDDYWSPEFLALMIAAMEQPGVVLAYCGWQNVGTTEGKPFVPPDYEAPDKLHHFLKFAALWPVHAAMVRRDALPPSGPFDEGLRSCEDYDLWLRTATLNPIQLVPHVLAYYRQHDEGQMTSNQARIGYYNLLVKKRFIDANPQVRARFEPGQLYEYCSGAFLRRGYRALWRGNLQSAHWIFRYALFNRMLRLKDLKYALPSLLPYRAYARLLKGRGIKSSK